MKLVILRNNLKGGLDMVSRAVGNNANLPIVSNVLIKTSENKVKISATNLEVGITASVSGKIIEDGSLTVPFDVLSSIVNNISSERINLEVKNNNLIITTDNYEASIQGIAESEFPIIPKLKNEKDYIEVSREEMADGLSKVILAAGFSDLRPEINGTLMVVESNVLRLVATDSFRLAEAKITRGFKNHLPEGVKVIVPLKSADILHKLSADKAGGDSVSVFFENNQIMFRSEGVEVISRVIDGKFPDYEAIIPKSLSSEVVVSREELQNALKLAGSFASRIKDVKLRGKEGKVVEVYSSDSALGENKYLIPGKISGSNFEVTFNLRYFMDGVKAESTEQIYLGINEDSRPAVIKSPSNQSYFYILMPVKA